GNSLERFGVLHNFCRVGETLQVIYKTLVVRLEDCFVQALGSVGRQIDPLSLCKLDQGLQPKGTVKMNMQVSLGYLFQEIVVVPGHSPRSIAYLSFVR